jgi:hypothetical protein
VNESAFSLESGNGRGGCARRREFEWASTLTLFLIVGAKQGVSELEK